MATVTTQSSWILLLSGIVLLMVHSKMKTAIAQAMKVMGDRFGSTEQDVAKAIQELKKSMQGPSEPSLSAKTVPGPGSQSSQGKQATIETHSHLQLGGA